MKAIVALLALISICGCSQQSSISAQQQATNSAPEKVYSQVTGGFGWNLGQIIPTNQDWSYLTNGPFQDILLLVDQSNILCGVMGYTRENYPLNEPDLKALLFNLNEKYGCFLSNQDGSTLQFYFGDLENIIIVRSDWQDTSIVYQNNKLMKVRESQNSNSRKQAMSGY